MHIVFFLDAELDSGRAKIIHSLQMCQAYSKYAEKVELYIPFGGIHSSEILDYVEKELGFQPGFTIIPIPLPSLFSRFKMLGGYLSVRRIAQSLNADLFVTLSPLILFELTRKKKNVVYEAHNSFINKNLILDKFFTTIIVKSSRTEYLKSFVAISQPLVNVWSGKGVPIHKINVQHDAVCELWLEKIKNVDRVREKFDWVNGDDDKKIVLYAGSLYEDRGLDRVLKLSDFFPNALFAIMGGPAKRAEFLRREVTKRKVSNVVILDRVPHVEVRKYIAVADILLMIWSNKVPTINYCSPMKLFEYMSAGKIIVGDGYPTIREILTHNKHALLAIPDNFEDLRVQLSRALSMSYPNQMAEAARELVQNEYTWNIRAKRILQAVDAVN